LIALRLDKKKKAFLEELGHRRSIREQRPVSMSRQVSELIDAYIEKYGYTEDWEPSINADSH